MHVRRVITGKSDKGTSVVISDGASPREAALKHTPGFVSAPLWVHAGTPVLSPCMPDPMAEGGSLCPSPEARPSSS